MGDSTNNRLYEEVLEAGYKVGKQLDVLNCLTIVSYAYFIESAVFFCELHYSSKEYSMISEREITFQMAALKDLVRMAKNAALWNTLLIIIGSALQITGLILLWQAMK